MSAPICDGGSASDPADPSKQAVERAAAPGADLRGRRVAVAMSGGVDSSAVAALLKAQGVDCVGLTMQTAPPPANPAQAGRARGCCSLQEVQDAEQVAWRLGIPHYTINVRADFEAAVVEDFVREYAAARTPNPCVRCNQHIKFDLLLERARALGADMVATGHYARIVRNEATGRWRMLRGRDADKDQSYVLYPLRRDLLEHTLFPLGGLTKAETRRLAHDFGLQVADKAESMEICFVAEGRHAELVRQRAPEAVRPGPVVDLAGHVLGTHRGLPWYTVGQRRGLGIAAAEPLYVVRLDRARNAVVLGPADALLASRFRVNQVNWIAPPLAQPRDAEVQIRYRSRAATARLTPENDDIVIVDMASPARAIAPGQAAVFYDGDEVLGGGTIDAVLD